MTTKIQYDTGRGPSGLRFNELNRGWYTGGQSGRLYYYSESAHGKPHLVRMDDDVECTSRYERAGTFIPCDVTVQVHTRPRTPPQGPRSCGVASADSEIIRRCRETFVHHVRAYFGLFETEDCGHLSMGPLAAEGSRLTCGNRDIWAPDSSPHYAALTMGIQDEMPDMREFLRRLHAAVTEWAEDQLGRPLTDEEREWHKMPNELARDAPAGA